MNRMSKKAASAVTAAFMLQVFSPLCTVSAETVLSYEEAEVSFEAEVSAGDSVDIDAANFPDDTFRKYVSDNFDTDKDGKLSRAEAEDVYTIDVSGTMFEFNTVSDLTGIGHFTRLVTLDCSFNQLTSLDVSNNSKLVYLSCVYNKLTSLDVSNNTKLTDLFCEKNQLTSLDLCNNTEIENFWGLGSTYTITKINGSFPLSSLPAGFDPAKAYGWTGAAYDSATNSLNNFTGETVTYKYNCGNGNTVTFTLKITAVAVSDVKVNSDNVVVTYSDDTSKTYSFDEVTEEIVNFMTENDMRSCAAFVNAFSANKDTMILTDAQLKAVEAVLESDYAV
ncbi:MAG: hypothetical protein ACI4RH_07705 [Huintestinicola sp.]